MKPVRRAVAVAVRHAGASARVLLVRRPHDDADLPDAWGLPAASLAPGERPENAVRRAGREKLGVELRVGHPLRSGTTERPGYVLAMTLFDATMLSGVPAVPQPFLDVTQYAAWRWGEAPDLEPAASRGSLCCRLFLEHAAGTAPPAGER